MSKLAIWKSVLFVAVSMQMVPAAAAIAIAPLAWGMGGHGWDSVHLLAFGVGVGAISGVTWRTGKRPIMDVVAINSAAVAIGWLLSSLLVAVPILTVCAFQTDANATTDAMTKPLNAWYEATSSISSSGLSVAKKSSELPMVIQLWRSVCQWIGGVGLAVFALLLLDSAELGKSLFKAETRSWHPGGTVGGVIKKVVVIYSALTIACGIAFTVAGMAGWEALNHCLIIVSTGGLTVTDDSFSSYDTTIQIIASCFMLLGAISFGVLYLASTSRWREWTQRTDVRCLTVWTATILGWFAASNYLRGGEDQQDALFNVISAITTCGVSRGQLSEFAVVSIWLLIVTMFVGGCSNSTAGGIKLNRMAWMLKTTRAQLHRNLGVGEPNEVPSWNGQPLDVEEAHQRTGRCLVMLFVYTTTLAIGFLGLRLVHSDEIASDRVFFQATSAIGAVGLSMGLVGPDRPPSSKLIEIVLMIAGRLEILALLFVIPVLAGRVSRR